MRLDHNNAIGVGVTLSRRNLKTLIAMLDSRELAIIILPLEGYDHMLAVVAEEDEVHYKGRVPAGSMPIEIEERVLAS